MGGGEIVNSAPPVSDQELQQLRGRARLVMYGLSSELQQAQDQLQLPPRYKNDKRTDHSDDIGTASLAAPILGGFAPATTASTAPTTAAGSIQPNPITSTTGSGPVLGSAGPLAPAQPSAPGVPPLTASPSPSLGNGGALPPVLTPGGGSPANQPPPLRPGPGSAAPERVAPRRLPGAGPSGPGRTVASGGVIGGTPVSGGVPNAQARANRINPVGGVIGGAGTATSGRGSARGVGPAGQTAPGHPAPMGGGVGGQRQNEKKPTHWDPDHPWETEQGVEPILLPPAPPRRIDPGPAIGYVR